MTKLEGIELLPRLGVAAPAGFVAGTVRAGIKSEGEDLALIVSEQPATAAALFTTNSVKAAALQVCARHAAAGRARAIIANAGNANCCTGRQGLDDALRMCELAATRIGCSPGEVLVCSTGIIGHRLPMPLVETAVGAIKTSRDNAVNEAVARAIMTTDTRPKYCAAAASIDGRTVTVGGVAKGVGMIGPRMSPYTAPHATLLAFLTTDAGVERNLLQEMLQEVVEVSFNSVTVDGDTSTNDTCLLLANGASAITVGEGDRHLFQALLKSVCVQLAKMVAADGEGATRLVTISVAGAADASDARAIALTVANSPLVKTAIFGGDPNWGRIAMAAGRSGAVVDALKMSISIGDVEVFRNGEPALFDLRRAEQAMQQPEVLIEIVLGAGSGSWTAWTCDFSYDYVKINAEYHT